MHSDPSTPSAPPPGWYPDPSGADRQRYWNGSTWTDATAPAHQPPPPPPATGPLRTWALAAHLSALLSLAVGLPFVGPLVVYLVKRDDPFARAHAAEALNFNISVTIYALVLGIATVVLMIVLVGFLLIPLLGVLAIAWLVLVIVASVRASEGKPYRYPLTIRFVN